MKESNKESTMAGNDDIDVFGELPDIIPASELRRLASSEDDDHRELPFGAAASSTALLFSDLQHLPLLEAASLLSGENNNSFVAADAWNISVVSGAAASSTSALSADQDSNSGAVFSGVNKDSVSGGNNSSTRLSSSVLSGGNKSSSSTLIFNDAIISGGSRAVSSPEHGRLNYSFDDDHLKELKSSTQFMNSIDEHHDFSPSAVASSITHSSDQDSPMLSSSAAVITGKNKDSFSYGSKLSSSTFLNAAVVFSGDTRAMAFTEDKVPGSTLVSGGNTATVSIDTDAPGSNALAARDNGATVYEDNRESGILNTSVAGGYSATASIDNRVPGLKALVVGNIDQEKKLFVYGDEKRDGVDHNVQPLVSDVSERLENLVSDDGDDTNIEQNSTEQQQQQAPAAEEQKKCTHCKTVGTPQWRAGPAGPGTLCNACGIRFRVGKLLKEYRPVKSPTFDKEKHSNIHKEVLKKRKEDK